MQIERLFKIVYTLLDKDLVTAKELAEKFEVSVRTIYRDVESLSSAGIPIYTLAGKGGGIALMDHFILKRSTISEEEQSQIIQALQNFSAAQYIDVDDTLLKLSGMFKRREASWIEVDYSRWGYGERDREIFGQLKQAILNKQRIYFTYSSSYGIETKRKAEPVKLVFKSRNWYLQAFCCEKQDYRTFKLTRIKTLQVLSEFYTAEHTGLPGLDSNNGENTVIEEIKLLAAPELTYRILDEFPEENTRQMVDGSLEITMYADNSPWLISYILSFGQQLKVLAPESIRETVREEIRKMLENYEDRTEDKQ